MPTTSLADTSMRAPSFAGRGATGLRNLDHIGLARWASQWWGELKRESASWLAYGFDGVEQCFGVARAQGGATPAGQRGHRIS